MKKCLLLICLGLLMRHGLHAQTNLDYYLNAAKKNSPLIQDNRNQAEANKLELERIQAMYTKSQVTFNAALAVSPIINRDNGRNHLDISPADATDYSGHDIAATNGGVYQALININQPLFNRSKLFMATEQNVIATQQSLNNIKIGEHDVEKLVGDQYILCLQDLKQIVYCLRVNELVTEQKSIVGKLMQSGLLKQSDLLLVSIEQQTQEGLLNTYRSTYRRDLMDLNILCGINDTNIFTLTDVKIEPTSVAHSNYLDKFRLDSLNLLATQKIFDIKYKPQFNAFANAGLNGVYFPTLPNRFGVSAGFNFSVFIFDGKQKQLSRKRTDLLVQTTQLYRANFVTQNNIRKNRLLSEIRSADERIAIAESQLKDYKTLMDLYRNEVSTGQQSVTNYITTLKNYTALERDYTLLQTSRQLLMNTYNYWNW